MSAKAHTLAGDTLALDPGSADLVVTSASGREVERIDLASCDRVQLSRRRGAGLSAVHRIIIPWAPLTSIAVAMILPDTALIVGAVLALVSVLVLVIARLQLAWTLVLGRGTAERVLVLAPGSVEGQLLPELEARLAGAAGPHPAIRNADELAAAEQRVRRLAGAEGRL